MPKVIFSPEVSISSKQWLTFQVSGYEVKTRTKPAERLSNERVPDGDNVPVQVSSCMKHSEFTHNMKRKPNNLFKGTNQRFKTGRTCCGKQPA
jgi:hypothetical protein